MTPSSLAALALAGSVFAGLGVLAVALWGNFVRRPAPSRVLQKAGARFPEGFLWGSSEDAYQHEGGNTNTDWHEWVHRDPSPIDRGARHGRGTNFWQLWRDDFARAKGDHHNAHRFGVEWSRLEPEPGVYDERAWAQYREMLVVAKEQHGFTTFLNIWHFTLPLWATATGGWEDPKLLERWELLVERLAVRLGPWVDYWSTMIDSQLYALGGYVSGEIPPCKKNVRLGLEVYERLIVAHARAYHVIHRHDRRDWRGQPKQARVGQIYFFSDFEARGRLLDPFIRERADRILNDAFLDALVTGDVDLALPFAPRIKRHDPLVKGTLDWLGVNYFTRTIVSFNPLYPGMMSRARQTPYPASDMQWEIYPEGLHRVLGRLAARYRGLPLIVTECGLADAQDALRGQFIVDHVAWAHQAIEDGVPLLGFFYWSLTDNWEWKLGDWPRFGLYRVDYATCERVRTASARLFAWISEHNGLPSEAESRRLLEERVQ